MGRFRSSGPKIWLFKKEKSRPFHWSCTVSYMIELLHYQIFILSSFRGFQWHQICFWFYEVLLHNLMNRFDPLGLFNQSLHLISLVLQSSLFMYWKSHLFVWKSANSFIQSHLQYIIKILDKENQNFQQNAQTNSIIMSG